MAFREDSTGTYTFPSNSTGSTVDLGARNTYRYINATNVYEKGKADTGSFINLVSNPISGLTFVPNHAIVEGDHYKISGGAVADCSGLVIRNSTGKKYGIVIACSVSAIMQAGYCTNSATLPTIVSQGAGRSGFISANQLQVFGITATTDSSANTTSIFYSFADGSVNPNNAKLYVYAIDCSKLT